MIARMWRGSGSRVLGMRGLALMFLIEGLEMAWLVNRLVEVWVRRWLMGIDLILIRYNE